MLEVLEVRLWPTQGRAVVGRCRATVLEGAHARAWMVVVWSLVGIFVPALHCRLFISGLIRSADGFGLADQVGRYCGLSSDPLASCVVKISPGDCFDCQTTHSRCPPELALEFCVKLLGI